MDERVRKESHGVMAKNFRSAVLLLALLLAAKAVGVWLGLPWRILLPEAAGLLCGVGVWAVWMSARGLWGLADERISEERTVCLSISWTVLHCVALLICTVLLADEACSMAYVLTAAAMTLIQYATLGRLTISGLYTTADRRPLWLRILCITVVVLALAPVMLWLMGRLRHETYEMWMYITVEVCLLVSCLLGGVLASAMAKRSSANAQKQLEQAEAADEE